MGHYYIEGVFRLVGFVGLATRCGVSKRVKQDLRGLRRAGA
jgi:hypothetical protein